MLEDEHSEVATVVAHGFESGEFGDMVGDIGEEDLVADDGTDDEAHDGADGEDDADGGGGPPEADFAGDEILLGEDVDFFGVDLFEGVPDGEAIGIGFELNETDVDDVEWIIATIAVREVVGDGGFGDKDGAIMDEVGTDFDIVDEVDFFAAKFDALSAEFFEIVHEEAVVLFGPSVEETGATVFELAIEFIPAGVFEGLGTVGDGYDADGAGDISDGADFGHASFDVDGEDIANAGGATGTLDNLSIEALFAGEVVAGLADEEEIGMEELGDLDRIVEEGVEEADLHKHEDDGEANAGGDKRHLGPIAGEVEPGEGCSVPPYHG